MNKDQIIQMARESGFDDYEQDAMLERFAAAIRSATKDEDAKICDCPWNGDSDTYEYSNACNECAEAIRASK